MVWLAAVPAWAVVYGQDVVDGSWDHVVALAHEDASGQTAMFCTAMQIADGHALTAAHCVNEGTTRIAQGGRLLVLWGEDLAADGPDGEQVWLEAWISHAFESDTLASDVGLVRFVPTDRGSRLPVLQAAPLADADVGLSVDVVGFGSTGDEHDDASVKRHATLVIETIDATNFVTAEGKANPCAGDSGAPASVIHEDDALVLGLAAFVGPQCEGGVAGFARIDPHAGWIADLVPNARWLTTDGALDVVDQVGEPVRIHAAFGEDTSGCAMAPGRHAAMAGVSLLSLLSLRRRKRSGVVPARREETRGCLVVQRRR